MEVFAILRAIRLLNETGESGRNYTIFLNPQAAISRVQHNRCGPAQALVKAAIAIDDDLCERNNALTIQ